MKLDDDTVITIICVALLMVAGCDMVHVDLGQTKTDTTLALCEPAAVATITTDESIPVIANIKSGTTTSQLQANYNCKGMVVMPKSAFRALRAKAFPNLPVVTLAAMEIPLGGAAVTVQTVIVEVGEPVEIATDTPLDVAFFDKTVGKQNCAGLYALKRSVYDALQAQANPSKEAKP